MLTVCAEYECDVVIGALGRKCTRCRDGKHPCVPVEQPLFELLKKVKTARAAYATAVRAADDQEEIDEREARARTGLRILFYFHPEHDGKALSSLSSVAEGGSGPCYPRSRVVRPPARAASSDRAGAATS